VAIEILNWLCSQNCCIRTYIITVALNKLNNLYNLNSAKYYNTIPQLYELLYIFETYLFNMNCKKCKLHFLDFSDQLDILIQALNNHSVQPRSNLLIMYLQYLANLFQRNLIKINKLQ